MAQTPEDKAFDVKISAEKRKDFAIWLSQEIENAISARTDLLDVRYWWTLYEQGRTRTDNAPWQDAADLTSYLITEKVDALRARIMRTIFVDPIWTVEGWGESASKAPFVEDFHSWAAESEGVQPFVGRAIHASLIEPRGVLEVFEDTTTRVTRKTINAQVQTQADPMNPMAPPTWVMNGETQEPKLVTDEHGRYVEVFDMMTPAAQVTVDEVERVRKGPGYRVISHEHFLVLPGHAREKADIFGYAKWFTKRVDQLEHAIRGGVYAKDTLEQIHPNSDIASQLSVSGENVPVAAQDGPTAEKEFWEVQLLHDLDGKGLRWYIATIHVPTRTLLRLKYDSINLGRFILFVPFPRTDRAHEGYSFAGHKLITVTEEHTAWRNMLADRASLVLSAPIKRLTTALWESDLQPMGPKAVIDVRDMKEIEPMVIPDLTAPAMQREQEVVNASERIAGINDVALGQSAQQNQTLGELEIRTEQSFVRMDEVIKNLQEPLEELGQIRNAIWARTLKDAEKAGGYYAPQHVFEGLDERGGDPCKGGHVPPDMLEGTFRFKPRGSTETADRAKLRADYMQGLQAIGQLAQIWPIMGATIQNNPQAAESALENFLRLYNIPDKQAWLGPIKALIQQQQQQAQLAQQAGLPPQIPGMAPPGLPGMGGGMPAPPGGPQAAPQPGQGA